MLLKPVTVSHAMTKNVCLRQPIRPSVEVILAKGMTVLDAKTVIVQELQSQGFLKLDIDR